MSKTQRVVLFLTTAAALVVIFYLAHGRVFLGSEHVVVLFSALLMLSFVTLFLEHFFTTPTDVLASTIAILLLISPLHAQLIKFGRWYWIFFSYNALLLLTSLTALLLVDQNRASSTIQNRLSSHLKRFSVFFGNGRFLFLALFLLTLFFYVGSQSWEFMVLAAYAAVVLLIDPKRFALATWQSRKRTAHDIGEIIGVQSTNTFLAKLYSDREPVRRFDLVEFRYSMAEDRGIFKGMIVDNYLLNEQQWIKILSTDEIQKAIGASPTSSVTTSNVVYKLDRSDVPDILSRFVGVVIDGSDIMKVRFDYAGQVPVSEGNLLETTINGQKLLYQVVQGLTDIETLEQKNEAGLIVGEAVQLGIWDPIRLVFTKFGWVPTVNTPLFLAPNPPEAAIGAGERRIGAIPGSEYPVLLNLQSAVTHHTAILGVTGTGKSVFCRDLIRKIISEGTKVICVDFTNEYRSKLADLHPVNIVPDHDKDQLFAAIDTLSIELEKFKNQSEPAGYYRQFTVVARPLLMRW